MSAPGAAGQNRARFREQERGCAEEESARPSVTVPWPLTEGVLAPIGSDRSLEHAYDLLRLSIRVKPAIRESREETAMKQDGRATDTERQEARSHDGALRLQRPPTGALVRLVAVGVAVAILAALGTVAQASAAATSRTLAADANPDNPYAITNLTPYTWTLSQAYSYYFTTGSFWVQNKPENAWKSPGSAPAPTLAPGETTNFLPPAYTDHSNPGKVWITYNFNDPQNEYLSYASNNGPFYCCKVDIRANYQGGALSSDYGAQTDPDGNVHHFDVYLNKPTTVTIDAKTNLQQAQEAFTRDWSDAVTKEFTPTTPITYSWSNERRASAILVNNTTQPDTLTISAGDTYAESSTVTEKMGVGAGVNVMGIVNTKINVSVSYSQKWSQSYAQTRSWNITAQPGYEAWATEALSQATVTGNFVFTTKYKLTYDIQNMTVTDPGVPDPNPPTGAPQGTQVLSVAGCKISPTCTF